MFELTLNGVKKYMESALILKNITFGAYSGEKVGIVGANGSGKTTILKLIAGIEPMNYWPGYPETSSPGYDEGFVNVPREVSVAYLEQILSFGEGLKVMDVLNLAFEEVYSIENEMRKLEDEMKALQGPELEKALKKYSSLMQNFEIKGGYNIEEKMSKVCIGLKFGEAFLNRDFDLLSGGEKTTVALGKLLIDSPDILLLDEPTNHLDMDSVEWLEGFLKAYKGIVIVVSHDRYFLDNVVEKIVEVEDMECETYRGNYSAYFAQKEEKLRVQFDDFCEQQKKINSLEKKVKELRDWAMRADNNKFFRRAASIQIKLDKLERVEKPVFEKRNMNLNLKSRGRSGFETIKAEGLCKSFGGKVIFKDADLLVSFGERVALIGPNGCGKTTFLKMLLGEELPDSGTVKLGGSALAAYLPQNVTFKDEELSALECFREDISILEGKAREYLSRFMFYGSNVFKKVKHLSGGERIRLKLARLLYDDVNLLILDEPTNHLDIDSIETLEEALEDFKGTIFFISHDRYFINKISERIAAVENYAFKNYDGSYDYYKNAKAELNSVVLKSIEDNTVKSVKALRPASIDENKKKEAEIAKTEARMKSLEDEIKKIDLVMEVSALDYEELNRLYLRKSELNRELDSVMEFWMSCNN